MFYLGFKVSSSFIHVLILCLLSNTVLKILETELWTELAKYLFSKSLLNILVGGDRKETYINKWIQQCQGERSAVERGSSRAQPQKGLLGKVSEGELSTCLNEARVQATGYLYRESWWRTLQAHMPRNGTCLCYLGLSKEDTKAGAECVGGGRRESQGMDRPVPAAIGKTGTGTWCCQDYVLKGLLCLHCGKQNMRWGWAQEQRPGDCWLTHCSISPVEEGLEGMQRDSIPNALWKSFVRIGWWNRCRMDEKGKE